MHEKLLRALQERRPQICARWEALLRLEPVHTPLAHPDMLVYLFDLTLDEVLAALPKPPGRPVRSRPKCESDINPMRAYFPALEQALLEALVLAQWELRVLTTEARVATVTELCTVLRRIARREIAVFDEICRQGPKRPTKRAATDETPDAARHS